MIDSRLAPEKDETLDSIGPVQILQRRDGYRFTLDAVLLASFALAGKTPRRVVDLGAGSGIVGLLLAKWAADQGLEELALVEIQASLASLARRNVVLNDVDVATVIESDLRRLPESVADTRYDLVVANPPWFEAGRFRLNPESEKAIARHELHCTLLDVAQTARRLMRDEGRFACVLPVQRLGHWYAALDAASLHPSRLRFVHPRAGDDGKVVLAEATRIRGSLSVEPPLIVHEGDGWSEEVEKLLDAETPVSSPSESVPTVQP